LRHSSRPTQRLTTTTTVNAVTLAPGESHVMRAAVRVE
jgi:hypothetical protein